MRRIADLALLAALFAAGAAAAQTYVPGQAQANVNQYQAQMQADQLQQLQRQNTQSLQQPNADVQAQALVRQQQIQQQIDQNMALQQQLLSPQANAADVADRLQQNGADIQHLQSPTAIQPAR